MGLLKNTPTIQNTNLTHSFTKIQTMFLLHKRTKNTFKIPIQTLKNFTVTFSTTTTTTTNPNPKPNTKYYDELINQAGHNRDFVTINNLLSKRITDGCSNTPKTFKFIAYDFAALNQLLDNLSLIKDWFARKHAHDSLITQLAALNRTADALRVAKLMVSKKWATVVTFHPILSTLAKKKEMDVAWRVLEIMCACGVKPDITAFNYVLMAYCVVGELEMASEVLENMEEGGIRVDGKTYEALVIGACRAGKVEGALDLIGRVVGEVGITVLYSCHEHVVKEMVRKGYFEQAVVYVRIFGGKDRKLDKGNFGFLVRSLKAAKRDKEAKKVVEEMESRGLVDDELMDLL